MPSRPMSSGSIRQRRGHRPRGQQRQRLLEPVGVVDERPADLELVQDEAVGVERRGLDAGPDEDQAPAAAQLVEAGLHGRLLARALEDDVDGSRREALGFPRRIGLERVGGDGLGRPEFEGQRAAGASPGSTTVTAMPRATRATMVRAPMGPAPKTMAVSPSPTPERVMPCRATASGSASAASRAESPAGRRSSDRAFDQHVAGEGAVVEVGVDRPLAAFALRGLALPAAPAGAAARRGAADDLVAHGPVRHAVAHGGDGAR